MEWGVSASTGVSEGEVRMRLVSLIVLFVLVGFAHAEKKKAFDGEGNCVPEVLAENARLNSEIEGFDKESAQIEKQLKSKDPATQKLAMGQLKKLGERAKATQTAVQKFGDTYGKDTACKAQVGSGAKPKVIMLKIGEIVTSLGKFSAAYVKMADDYLKVNESRVK